MKKIILSVGKFISGITIIALAILVLLIEYILNKDIFCPETIILFEEVIIVVFSILFGLILYKNKGLSVVKGFVSAHEGQVSSFLGLFHILFVFVQLHIIGTEIHEAIFPSTHSGRSHQGSYEIWIANISYCCLLFIPFFVHGLSIKTKAKIDKGKRKVLVTGISFNKASQIKLFYEKGFLENEIKPSNNNYWNWLAIKMNIAEYYNINKVIFLVDKKAGKEITDAENSLNAEFGTTINILKTFVDSIRKGIDIETVSSDTFNDFNTGYTKIKPVIESRLAKYKNEEIIMNLTPGTTITSAAVTLWSLKGNRGLCYLTQFSPEEIKNNPSLKEEIKEFDISVFDIEDVVSVYFNRQSH